MTPTLASFLRPEGFECPLWTAVLREGSAVTEAAATRSACWERRIRMRAGHRSRRLPHQRAGAAGPGFMAGTPRWP